MKNDMRLSLNKNYLQKRNQGYPMPNIASYYNRAYPVSIYFAGFTKDCNFSRDHQNVH